MATSADKRRKPGRIAGTRLLPSLRGVFVERRRRKIAVQLSVEEREKLWFRICCGFCFCLLTSSILGCRVTIAQVYTQLQRKVFTLKSQVVDQSALADGVRAMNSLATHQVRRDTPSPIDVKGRGRPKESTGNEEDFQQWWKKTEAFFAGVMKLEWSAEQVTEITHEPIDLEFLPIVTNVKRRVRHLEFVLHQMHTTLMALTTYQVNDRVANTRKKPLEAWRRLQKRYDPTTGGRKRIWHRTIISFGGCSLSELQAEIERWESYVSRYEKKFQDTSDDEIKVAGLEGII